MSLTLITALIVVAFLFFCVAYESTKKRWIDPRGFIAITLFVLCIAVFFGTNPHGEINQISFKKVVSGIIIFLSALIGIIIGNKK